MTEEASLDCCKQTDLRREGKEEGIEDHENDSSTGDTNGREDEEEDGRE